MAGWREADLEDRLRYEARQCAGPSTTSQQQENTLYSLLGLNPGASQTQLRRAWLQLLPRVHPDKGGCPAVYARLHAAYATLSDPAERLLYDEQLERTTGPQLASNSSSGGAGGGQRVVRQQGGARTVVHGQTQPTKPAPQPASAAEAGGHCCEQIAGGEALAAVTDQLQQLLMAAERQQGDERQRHLRELARLYVQRAALQQKRGRLHHALFDCEEALAADPDCSEASELADEVQREQAAAAVAGRASGQRCSSSCSEGSSDEGVDPSMLA